MPRKPGLSAEQRAVLERLADSTQNGATEAIWQAHGFSIEMLDELVRARWVTATPGAVRSSGRLIRVRRFRVADAGKKALEGDALRHS